MPSPALAFPFRLTADQIDRTARDLNRAHETGECGGMDAATWRRFLIEDIGSVIEGCGPDELVELARVVAKFARGVV